VIITQEKLKKLSKDGLRIALGFGCFDILHVGHIRFINKIKKNSSKAVAIGVTDDSLVRYLKGEGRPINTQNFRLEVIANLKAVKYAFIIDDIGDFEYYKQKYSLINEDQEIWKKLVHCINGIRPHDFFYSSDFVMTQNILSALKNYTTVVHDPIPYVEGISTSKIISQMKNER